MKTRIACTFTCTLACIAVLLVSSRAVADIPPADAEPCMGKAAGAACTYGGAGTCQEQTCTKPSGSYACLKCVPGTSTTTATGTNTDTNTSGDSGWCSVGKGTKNSVMAKVGPWMTGGLFALFFVIVRRRKQQ
jgi:hypothetical protein